MTTPTPVEIVRPKRSTAANAGLFIGRWTTYLLDAYLIMLLLPVVVHGWDFSYLRSLALVLVVQWLVGTNDWMVWSRDPARQKKAKR